MNEIYIYANNSVSIGLTFTDDKFQPIDVSGKTLLFTVKYNKYDPDSKAMIKKSSVIPTNTDTQNGVAVLSLSTSENNLIPGIYLFDITLETLSPKTVTTILVGRLIVDETVTKDF